MSHRRSGRPPLLLPLLAFAATLGVASAAEASHFRYGNIGWSVPDPVNAPLTVGAQMGTLIGSGTDLSSQDYSVFQYNQPGIAGGGLGCSFAAESGAQRGGLLTLIALLAGAMVVARRRRR